MAKEGWSKQGIQIPDHISDELKSQADRYGQGAIKILSTAGIAFILSLPEDQLDIVYQYVHQRTWKDPARLNERTLKELVRRLMDGNLKIVNAVDQVEKAIAEEESEGPA